jgi:hypothetical protein
MAEIDVEHGGIAASPAQKRKRPRHIPRWPYNFKPRLRQDVGNLQSDKRLIFDNENAAARL